MLRSAKILEEYVLMGNNFDNIRNKLETLKTSWEKHSDLFISVVVIRKEAIVWCEKWKKIVNATRSAIKQRIRGRVHIFLIERAHRKNQNETAAVVSVPMGIWGVVQSSLKNNQTTRREKKKKRIRQQL